MGWLGGLWGRCGLWRGVRLWLLGAAREETCSMYMHLIGVAMCTALEVVFRGRHSMQHAQRSSDIHASFKLCLGLL